MKDITRDLMFKKESKEERMKVSRKYIKWERIKESERVGKVANERYYKRFDV